MTSSFGLLQIISEATRTASSRSLIDHVYASSSSLIHSSRVLPPLGSSDHSSIEIRLNVAKPRQFHPKRRIWLYKRAGFGQMNEDLFKSLLDNYNDTSLSSDPNLTWLTFRYVVTKAMRRFIPSKLVSCRKFVLWLTAEVKKAMRKRDKAHKAAKLHDTSGLWRAFRKLRNKAVTILRQSKAFFFGSLSSKLSSLKDFWSSVHSITKESRQVPQELRMNSSTVG